MKLPALILGLSLTLSAQGFERVKITKPVITTMALKYHGRHMSCGGYYDKHDSFVAINRAGYCNDTAWCYKGFMGVRVIICDRFNTCKDSLPFLKVDSPAWVLRALGMKGKGKLDSVQIFHKNKVVVFK